MLRTVLVSSPLILTLACTTTTTILVPDGGSSGNAAENDAGPPTNDGRSTTADAGPATAPEVKSDGGTIDAGAPEGGPPEICGGFPGDPTAVKVLDWSILPGGKYRVPLGGDWTDSHEPGSIQITGTPWITGTRTSTQLGMGQAALATGPYKSTTGGSDNEFASVAFPPTEAAAGRFGYTDGLTAIFDLATKYYGENVLSSYRAGYRIARDWTLDGAHGTATTPKYVKRIVAANAAAFVFAVKFDAPCKMSGLKPLLGDDNPLVSFDPPAGHTRDEVQSFLVANGAEFKLSVFQSGPVDDAIKAALENTRCSPATLDACKTTFDALSAALDAFTQGDGPGDADYDALVAGTLPKWTIGEVDVDSTAGLAQ